MGYDSRLWFSTKIDNTKIEKDLKEIERKIKKSNESISKMQNTKLPLVKQAEALGAKLDAAKAKAEQLRKEMESITSATQLGTDPVLASEAFSRKAEIEAALKASEKEVEKLQNQWDSVNDKLDAYDLKIKQANTDIERATEEASKLQAKLATPNQIRTAQAMEKAEKSANRFNRRLREIVKSALIFNLISSGLRSVVNYMGTALKSNAQYTAQLAQLKGAWLTAFQPIYDFVLPGLLAIMRVLTAIGNALAAVLSFFSGKTATQSAKNAEALNKEAEAIGGVGSAAEEAQKQLMGFDEINRLESTSTGASGGGGGGTSGTVEPDFSGITDMEDELMQILGLVAAIAAGLLTWKIASMFTDSLALAAGLGIAVGGAMLLAFNWADAFANGIDWDNLSGMLLGILAIVGGLTLAFGTTGAAIGLLIGGIALVVLALYEWIKTGQLSTEACTALVLGIMAIGTAIAIFTGSWIPLLVAGIASAIVLIAKNWDSLKEKAMQVWETIKDYFERTFADGFIHGLATMVEDAVMLLWNFFIDFINSVIENWNSIWGNISSYHTTGTYDAVSGYNMPAVSSMDIPALAQGAVLPANRPFMAMVGDQRNGTNIEAPLETIKQALAEVMAQYGGGDIQITFTGELAALGRVLAPVVTKAQKNNDRGQGR